MATPAIEPSLEQLRADAIAAEQQPATQVATPEAPPAALTPPVEPTKTPEPYTITQGPEGVTVTMASGMKFSGKDPMEALAALAKSNAETHKWAHGLNGELQELKKTVQPPAPEPPAPAAQSPEEVLQQYLRDQYDAAKAKELGFQTVDAYRGWQKAAVEREQQVAGQMVISKFMQECPDFPGTPEAGTAIEGVMKKYSLPENLGGLVAAHAIAVQQKLYAPATPASALPVRPTPNPTLVTGASPAPAVPGEKDLWSMPLEQLRGTIK